jgi:hypothetical protein
MSSSAHADLIPSTQFTPISLAALNTKAEMLRRRDNKYIIERPVLVQALKAFAAEFDVLEINGQRSFTYDTCYFDSAQHECYQDHHRGRRRRAKVRIRNYVDANICFVEVKLKDKRGETIKKRLKHDPARHQNLDAPAISFVNHCFQDLYGKPFPYELRQALDMRYNRVTLVAKSGGERLTIDNKLHFKDGNKVRAIHDDIFIVETKSSNGNGIADKVLRSLHRHPMKHCSKYCAATAILCDEVKTNNFRQVRYKLLHTDWIRGHITR